VTGGQVVDDRDRVAVLQQQLRDDARCSRSAGDDDFMRSLSPVAPPHDAPGQTGTLADRDGRPVKAALPCG
jgi:hypothetical protein